jgi:hypothetical protein
MNLQKQKQKRAMPVNAVYFETKIKKPPAESLVDELNGKLQILDIAISGVMKILEDTDVDESSYIGLQWCFYNFQDAFNSLNPRTLARRDLNKF